ncbi:MAG: hypothetical protein VCB25_05075 [Myxococcota bacterium]|jgi:hypothetical protein
MSSTSYDRDEQRAQWVRWGIGTVVTFALPLMLYAISAINDTNARQDERLAEMQDSQHSAEMRQERVYREIFEQSATTSRVLEGLLERVQAVDERGSRALRTHEAEHRRE